VAAASRRRLVVAVSQHPDWTMDALAASEFQKLVADAIALHKSGRLDEAGDRIARRCA
jgi:hypothetical protein